MPSVKCGGCAKFFNPNIDAAKCSKCNVHYHRACVGLPVTSCVSSTWRCPECMRYLIRDNKAETPVRGKTDHHRDEPAEVRHADDLTDTSQLNSTALDATVPPSPVLVNELRLFKEELRAEFRLLRSEFQEFRTEMCQLQSSMKACDERMDSLDAKVNALEHKLEQKVLSDRGPLENTIAELRCQLNERDQELLLNDVEVAGIPESKDESALHLTKLLCIKLGVVMDERDVVHAERVGSIRRNRVEGSDNSTSADPAAQRPRNISVRFARRATRDALLRAARVRRGLTTIDIEVAGPARRVYINERLTRTNRHLFYCARQEGSRQNWRFVWTRDGKILARKEDGRKAERIRSEDDIVKIFG